MGDVQMARVEMGLTPALSPSVITQGRLGEGGVT
jgi:hypothetical protein